MEDILSRFDVTTIEAAHFLADIERQLRDSMTVSGWEVIDYEAAQRGLVTKPEEEWEY